MFCRVPILTAHSVYSLSFRVRVGAAFASRYMLARHGLYRSNAVILVIVQEARNLPLQLGRLSEIGEGGSVFEEFALDFGWECAPSHDDGRSQIFQNFLVFGEGLIDLHLREGRGGATLVLPPCNRCGVVTAKISLMIFSGGHFRYMGCISDVYQWAPCRAEEVDLAINRTEAGVF
jgi:hypothetical protein